MGTRAGGVGGVAGWDLGWSVLWSCLHQSQDPRLCPWPPVTVLRPRSHTAGSPELGQASPASRTPPQGRWQGGASPSRRAGVLPAVLENSSCWLRGQGDSWPQLGAEAGPPPAPAPVPKPHPRPWAHCMLSLMLLGPGPALGVTPVVPRLLLRVRQGMRDRHRAADLT